MELANTFISKSPDIIWAFVVLYAVRGILNNKPKKSVLQYKELKLKMFR